MAVWVTGSTTGAGTGAEGGALATGWGAGGGAAGATGWGFGSIGLKRAGSAAMISGFAGSSGLAGFAGSMAGGAISPGLARPNSRSEEHTSELQSIMRISYAGFCLKKNKHTTQYINK